MAEKAKKGSGHPRTTKLVLESVATSTLTSLLLSFLLAYDSLSPNKFNWNDNGSSSINLA